jgi:hypothetical protein
MLHATLLVGLLLFFSGGGGSSGTGAAGKGGGDFLEVGISSPRGGGSAAKADVGEAESVDPFPAVPSLPTFNSSPTSVVDDKPPISLTAPKSRTSVASIDAAPPTAVYSPPSASAGPRTFGQTAGQRGFGSGLGNGVGSGEGDGTGTGGGAGDGQGKGTGSGIGDGDGPGITRFFNLMDRGGKFVYVLDRSVSMSEYNAIRVAKHQLMQSLEGLTVDQQFQIVFYNNKPEVLRLGNDSGENLVRASDINRTLAGQFIAGITPESSTSHLAAIERGLAFRPDVLFLLTDAGEPQLSRPEMERIRRMNGGRTRIHCVEFHQGRKLAAISSFLEKLAKENGGTYEFCDITQFVN